MRKVIHTHTLCIIQPVHLYMYICIVTCVHIHKRTYSTHVFRMFHTCVLYNMLLFSYILIISTVIIYAHSINNMTNCNSKLCPAQYYNTLTVCMYVHTIYAVISRVLYFAKDKSERKDCHGLFFTDYIKLNTV